MSKANAKKQTTAKKLPDVENTPESEAVAPNENKPDGSVTFNLGQTVTVAGVLGAYVITFINKQTNTVNLLNINGQNGVQEVAVACLRAF